VQQTDVRWSGRPRRGLVLRAGDAYTIPFSLVWSALTTFMAVSVLRQPSDPGPGAFVVVVLCVVGLYCVVGRFVVDLVRRQGLSYELTGTEAIVRSRSGTTVVSLAAAPCIALRRELGGSGTILLGYGGRGDYSWLGWGFGVAAFEAIPDAEAVFERCIVALGGDDVGTVLWEGAPYAGIVLRRGDWPIALYGLLLFAFAAATGVAPFAVALGLVAAYNTVGRLAIAARRREVTQYVLTDRVAIARAKRPWGREVAVPLTGAPAIRLRREPSGRGTIVFGPDDIWTSLYDTNGYSGGQPRIPAFELLDTPQVVYERVMQARAAATPPRSG
jgi:hypothetical protein